MKTLNAGLLTGALLGLFASLALAAEAPQNPPAPPSPAVTSQTPAAPPPLTDKEASYLFGLTLGEQLHGVGLASSLQRDEIERGVQEGLAGKKSSQEDRHRVQEYVRASMAAQAERNKQASQDFLAKNAKEKGVKTTDSGLEYRVLKAGDPKAASPAAMDQVTVNYRGRLIDGSEFDSSAAHGRPAEFPLNGVIKGWQEGIALMKPGAKFELFVPPELGYGASPRPGIPGNSLLIFEVELVSVRPSGADNPPPLPPARPASSGAPPKAGAAPEPQARSVTQP